jgi:hypothetical protein
MVILLWKKYCSHTHKLLWIHYAFFFYFRLFDPNWRPITYDLLGKLKTIRRRTEVNKMTKIGDVSKVSVKKTLWSSIFTNNTL